MRAYAKDPRRVYLHQDIRRYRRSYPIPRSQSRRKGERGACRAALKRELAQDLADALHAQAVEKDSGPVHVTEEPRFVHDCDSCMFLWRDEPYDVWFCPRCDGGTYLFRYGNDPWQYSSYPCFVLKQLPTYHRAVLTNERHARA